MTRKKELPNRVVVKQGKTIEKAIAQILKVKPKVSPLLRHKKKD